VTAFPRLLCLACLATLFAPRTPAQEISAEPASPPADTIRSWLLSEDPRLVAWGAHDALLTQNQDVVPELLSLASQWQPLPRQTFDPSAVAQLSRQQIDQRDAMAAVLDTLIQMKVPVPADTLRILAPDFGNNVAVLLSRMPPEEAGPLAFDLYRASEEKTFSLQYVSAALLALHPVPGFAADLLASIKVRALVFAVTPGTGGGTGGSSGACGYGLPGPHEDWPMTGQYALSTQKSDGAMLLVGGIDPIYATRRESTNYLGDFCGSVVYLSMANRQHLIAQMLGVSPDAIPWQTDVTTYIEFQSLAQFDDAVLTFVEEQQKMYRATAAALAGRNLLTASESEDSIPELHLHLNDARADDAIPISTPPNLPARVQWSPTPY
jgi:hypothetical protein